MIRYEIKPDSINIIDSAYVSKHLFDSVLDMIEEECPDNLVFLNRKRWHLKSEWAVHNFLFKLGYKEKRTKNCRFEYPQDLKYKIGYVILGPLCWIFIN